MARRALTPAQLALVQAVRVALAGWDATRRWSVRVACSGGADSLALVAALAWCGAHEPDPLRHDSAMVVDHALQDDSAAVAARVVGVLEGLGLDAEAVRVSVDTESSDGLEAAARQARYGALARADADVVLLGHTLDDQAETVLLGLARGSGTRSLAGMPSSFRWGEEPDERRGQTPGAPEPALPARGPHGRTPLPRPGGPVFVRPLLGLRRRLTAQACHDWGLEAWDDPMNSEGAFARVRARRLMPSLEDALGPGVAEALARTAALARDDADHLDALAGEALRAIGPSLDGLPTGWLGGLPPALRGRVIRAWLTAAGLPAPEYPHVHAVLALVTDWHGQRGADVPGATVVRDGNRLLLR